MRVIDVSNSQHPAEVGFYKGPAYTTNMAEAGNRVYVADGDQGLKVLNVADKTNPQVVATYTTRSGAGRRRGMRHATRSVRSRYAGA